jgi:hypothetical protein
MARLTLALSGLIAALSGCGRETPLAPTPQPKDPGTPAATTEFVTLLGTADSLRRPGAGLILLLGTDAASLHDDGTFQTPVFTVLHGGRAEPVLVVNNIGLTTGSPLYDNVGPLAFVTAAEFGAASGPITGYSGLFFASRDRCCFDEGDDVARRAGDIAAFVDSGGNLGVEDYQGHSTWDATLRFAGRPGVVAGLGTSLTVDHPCINPGFSTDLGVALGFRPTYTEDDGCFAHQLYDPAFWTSHGFSALQTASTPAAVPAARARRQP